MDSNNLSGITIDDALLDESDFSTISTTGMAFKQMAEKIRKLEAELLNKKEANEFGGSSTMMQMGLQIGEKLGKMENELARMGKQMAELGAENGTLKEEMKRMKGEMRKLDNENGKLKEENAGKGNELKEMEKKVAEMKVEINGLKEEINEKHCGIDEKMDKMMRENGVQFVAMNGAILGVKNEFGIMQAKIQKIDESKASAEELASLSERIDKMDENVKCMEMKFGNSIIPNAMKMNKWNKNDCGPQMEITDNGLVLTHSINNSGINLVRAEFQVPKLNRNAPIPSIAAYFEVEILKKFHYIFIGFCDRKFPVQNHWLNGKNSIGICNKGYGMAIDGNYSKFENIGGGDEFKVGDVVGIGLVRSEANLLVKCFASLNGKLLGSKDLPIKFSDLELFPAAAIFNGGDSIRANFGMEKWRFNPIQQLA